MNKYTLSGIVLVSEMLIMSVIAVLFFNHLFCIIWFCCGSLISGFLLGIIIGLDRGSKIKEEIIEEEIRELIKEYKEMKEKHER